MVFLLSPSLQVLRTRLESGGVDDENSVERRLHIAQDEVNYYPSYEYVIRYSSYQPRIDTLRSPHGEWSNPISPPTEKQVFSPMSRLKTASDPWGYPDIFIKIRSAETLLLPLDQKHGL